MGATIHSFADASAARLAHRLLGRHSAGDIADAIEVLIDVLDLLGGDPEAEDSDPDHCSAGDDNLSDVPDAWFYGPGDPDDAEDEDEDRCLAGDDGCGIFIHAGNAAWGADN